MAFISRLRASRKIRFARGILERRRLWICDQATVERATPIERDGEATLKTTRAQYALSRLDELLSPLKLVN